MVQSYLILRYRSTILIRSRAGFAHWHNKLIAEEVARTPGPLVGGMRGSFRPSPVLVLPIPTLILRLLPRGGPRGSGYARLLVPGQGRRLVSERGQGAFTAFAFPALLTKMLPVLKYHLELLVRMFALQSFCQFNQGVNVIEIQFPYMLRHPICSEAGGAIACGTSAPDYPVPFVTGASNCMRD